MEDPKKIIGVTEVCNQLANIYRKKMEEAKYNKEHELYNFQCITEWNGYLFEVIFNLPEYWKYAENGRPPGEKPPYTAIRDWMIFKKLIPSSKANRIPRDYAFIANVRRTIAEKGTRAYRGIGGHLLEKSTEDPEFDKLADNLVELITAEFEKEIEKELKKI